MKIAVIRSEEGKIVQAEVIEGEFPEAIKGYARRAFEEWDPGTSDFTVLKTTFEVRYRLPINADLVDVIRDLQLPMMKEGNELIVQVPIATVSFDNIWINDAYHEKKMYIIAPYLDESEMEQLKGYAADATREPKRLDAGMQFSLSEEELRRLEEGLAEMEQEEKPKRRRRRRKKSS